MTYLCLVRLWHMIIDTFVWSWLNWIWAILKIFMFPVTLLTLYSMPSQNLSICKLSRKIKQFFCHKIRMLTYWFCLYTLGIMIPGFIVWKQEDERTSYRPFCLKGSYWKRTLFYLALKLYLVVLALAEQLGPNSGCCCILVLLTGNI